ncbi:MAG: hypothetical protein H6510_01005 [Acidobacteria bacterium]|nr:hypothetical protein [Acidobacteriota bacterium]MCB9396367.1 hypothetical protein [Acidobacteriota bacterium]
MLLFCFFWFQANDTTFRDRVFADIQAAVGTHQPTIWGVTDPRLFVELSWQHPHLRYGLSYHRSVVRALNQLVLVETWRFSPDNLAELCRLFGHREWVAWENILAEIPNGRIVASKDRGELIILRDFEPSGSIWRQPPFDLAELPTLGNPTGPAPTVLFSEEHPSQFAIFLNDVFTEELLDRDGLKIRISKHWNFVNHFSRLSPFVRIERSVRLDYNGTFSVFDIYSFGGDFLLGSHTEDKSGAIVETGALLNLDKSIVVIRSGLPTWHQAVFSKPFNPKNFPVSPEALKRLPLGVRFVFPATSGLSLVERAQKPTSWWSQILVWRLRLYLGVNGNFFISVVRRNETDLELRFGGRIERYGEANLRLRPDFDGTFDPLRLLVGSVIQLRGQITDGTKLILEKKIDLRNDKELKLVTVALRRGIRFNGMLLGLAGVLNFTFLNRYDTFLVEQFINGKLPEIDWEISTLSHFRLGQNYGKIGIRLASARKQKEKLFDDWQIHHLQPNGAEYQGNSTRITAQSVMRWFNHIDRRRTELRAVQAEADPLEKFVELSETYEESKLRPREQRKIKAQIERVWAEYSDLEDRLDWSPDQDFHDVQFGYRLLLTTSGMNRVRDFLRDGARPLPPELKRWLRRHPLMVRKLNRAEPDSKQEFESISQLLYKMARAHAPIHLLFAEMEPQDYFLEWRVVCPSQPGLAGQSGEATLAPEELRTWQRWESLSVLDDLYIDRSLSESLD